MIFLYKIVINTFVVLLFYLSQCAYLFLVWEYTEFPRELIIPGYVRREINSVTHQNPRGRSQGRGKNKVLGTKLKVARGL